MALIKVLVKPKSKKSEILEKGEDYYKISLKAAPVDGKANNELVKFLHKLTKKKVSIVRGLKSKEKIIKLE